jgi:hypothetical protein
MRRRFTYANVTATLALVFAMSGAAIAGHHYLINSTKQINPKVLKALKGRTGARGPAGAPGAPGATGATGTTGATGSYPTVLPSGATETGDWGAAFTAGGEAEYRAVASFPIPLPGGLEPSHVIYVAGTSLPNCPGSGLAERGYLCVYQHFIENAEPPSSGEIFNTDENGGPAGVGTHGFGITLESKKAGLTTVSGTFAVTAP